MKQGSPLAALALATILFAAGCGNAGAEGKVLQISAGGSDISTLDAHRATATTDKALVGWMYNGLVRFPPGSADPKDIEPDLAERWESSPDSKTWTFVLRKGVKFHGNRGELTADDVVYSLTRSADPKRSSFAADFAGIGSITKVDDHTVRIVLKYSDPNFLGRVSNYHGGNIVSKKAAEELGDKFGANPVGTGPFAFVENVTQQYVKLVAHEGYFRGRPKIETIMYRLIPSDSARELAFTSGELDVMYAKREQRWVDAARKRGNMHGRHFPPRRISHAAHQPHRRAARRYPRAPGDHARNQRRRSRALCGQGRRTERLLGRAARLSWRGLLDGRLSFRSGQGEGAPR